MSIWFTLLSCSMIIRVPGTSCSLRHAERALDLRDDQVSHLTELGSEIGKFEINVFVRMFHGWAPGSVINSCSAIAAAVAQN